MQPPSVVLPSLTFRATPNESSRRGALPYLIALHRPVGSIAGTISTILNPNEEVSYHVLVCDGGAQSVQFVSWSRKAWSCETFNRVTYNVCLPDKAWVGDDEGAWLRGARTIAYLCKRTGIPPIWSTDASAKPGVIRHSDLGRAGGDHSDPTQDIAVWRRFVARVKDEFQHGGFRPTYGEGELKRIDV